MQFRDFQREFEDKFKIFLSGMKKEDILLAQKGKEKLRVTIYETPDNKKSPLKKVSFLVLENGRVKNKDDRNILDECELTAISFIPEADLPLPILALEVSIHINKYDHLNADIFPLSKDRRYRDTFSAPVNELRSKYEGLEGVIASMRNAGLDDFTSGGMLAGDFDITLREKSMSWFSGYAEIYNNFLEKHDKIPLLKDRAIIEEGKKTREIFLSMFRKASPRILTDIPNLCSDEIGVKLGELLF